MNAVFDLIFCLRGFVLSSATVRFFNVANQRPHIVQVQHSSLLCASSVLNNITSGTPLASTQLTWGSISHVNFGPFVSTTYQATCLITEIHPPSRLGSQFPSIPNQAEGRTAMSYRDIAARSMSRTEVQSGEPVSAGNILQQRSANPPLIAETILGDDENSSERCPLRNNKSGDHPFVRAHEYGEYGRRCAEVENHSQNETLHRGSRSPQNTNQMRQFGGYQGDKWERIRESRGVVRDDSLRHSSQKLARTVDGYPTAGHTYRHRDEKQRTVRGWSRPRNERYPSYYDGCGLSKRSSSEWTYDPPREQSAAVEEVDQNGVWLRRKKVQDEQNDRADFGGDGATGGAVAAKGGSFDGEAVGSPPPNSTMSFVGETLSCGLDRPGEKAPDLATIACTNEQPPQWKDSLAPIQLSPQSVERRAPSRDSTAHQGTLFPVHSRPNEREWIIDESCREEVNNVYEEKTEECEGGKGNESGEPQRRNMKDVGNAAIVFTDTTNHSKRENGAERLRLKMISADETAMDGLDYSAPQLVDEEKDLVYSRVRSKNEQQNSKTLLQAVQVDVAKIRCGHSQVKRSLHDADCGLLSMPEVHGERPLRIANVDVVSKPVDPHINEGTNEGKSQDTYWVQKDLAGGDGEPNATGMGYPPGVQDDQRSPSSSAVAFPQPAFKRPEAAHGRFFFRSGDCHIGIMDRQLTYGMRRDSRRPPFASKSRSDNFSGVSSPTSDHRESAETTNVLHSSSCDASVGITSTTASNKITSTVLDGNVKDNKKSTEEEEIKCRESDHISADSSSGDEAKRYTAAGTVAAPPVSQSDQDRVAYSTVTQRRFNRDPKSLSGAFVGVTRWANNRRITPRALPIAAPVQVERHSASFPPWQVATVSLPPQFSGSTNPAFVPYRAPKVYEGGQQWRGGYRGDRGSPLGGVITDKRPHSCPQRVESGRGNFNGSKNRNDGMFTLERAIHDYADGVDENVDKHSKADASSSDVAKNRQEEAEKILAVQFDSNVGVAAVVKQSDPCNVRAVVEDEFSGNSNQDTCDVPMGGSCDAGNSRMVFGATAAQMVRSKKMVSNSVLGILHHESSTQSPEKPTVEAACQTSLSDTLPIISSSFRSSCSSIGTGNKRIRRGALNEDRLLENLPKVIRSENSSPRLWSASELEEHCADAALARSQNTVNDSLKALPLPLAQWSTPRKVPPAQWSSRRGNTAPHVAGVSASSGRQPQKEPEMSKADSSNEENNSDPHANGKEDGEEKQDSDKDTECPDNVQSSIISEYEQPPRAVNDIAIDTHMQTRNDGSRSPESTHDLHDVVADAHAVSLVTVTATCEKDMPPFPTKGSPSFQVSMMDVLSEEIWHLHTTLTQSEMTLGRKLHLRDVLYCYISQIFPMCGLYMVGSSLNGFGTNSSDMDLCLMISRDDLDQRTDALVILKMVAEALVNLKSIREQVLIPAKVPILRLKFMEPFAELAVDLNVNNSVAIRNTHLLYYYSLFDWRVRPIVTVVKEWAKRRDMNDANRSTFTSYSLVLMVIHYFQCGVDPPLLPSLQRLYPVRFDRHSDVRKLDMSVPLNPAPSVMWPYRETNTLGELLLGFLDYYANEFDYLHDAISVRLGRKVDRAIVARQRSQHNNMAQWTCVCIEEPFNLSNTAHSVHSQMVFDAIRQAFTDGFKELDANRDLHAFLNAPPIHVSTPYGSTAHLNEFLSINSGRKREAMDSVRSRLVEESSSLSLPSADVNPLRNKARIDQNIGENSAERRQTEGVSKMRQQLPIAHATLLCSQTTLRGRSAMNDGDQDAPANDPGTGYVDQRAESQASWY
uniref:PAP-associated domain-containing protein n=1 Tax=Ascaris lumbricoides TaxID=6252 RepID=A0A9J2PKF9_ASCLU